MSRRPLQRAGNQFNVEVERISYTLDLLQFAMTNLAPLTQNLSDVALRNQIDRFYDRAIMTANIRSFDVYGLLLSRVVDNFQIYLTDLLAVVFEAHPETLRSKEQISIELALRAESISDLRRIVAERKIERLTYVSFDDLRLFFDKRFGVRPELSPSDIDSVKNAVLRRNLIVHRRSVVDERFLHRIGRQDLKVGDKVTTSAMDVRSAIDATANAKQKFEAAVHQQFSDIW